MMSTHALSNTEERLMNIFWKEKAPLTSAQLGKLASDTNWSANYIHKMLQSLQKKGFLTVCGMVQEGSHYSRQFLPCFDKEQYISDLLENQGVTTASFAKIAVAFVKKAAKKKEHVSEQDTALLEELEKMIEQYESEDTGDD